MPKYLGFGLGLRAEHYDEILETKPSIDWFEIITENYLMAGGKPLYYLNRIREQYPIVMHGVSLSIGSTDPLNWEHLKQVKALARRLQPAWISEHLCWTGVNGVNTHDLLPLPYTEEAIKHVVTRLEQVQEYLGVQLLLENVSSYFEYPHSTIPEWEFLSAIANRADCLILLDINNIYVSAFNHGYDPSLYLQHIPIKRVAQFHLAGHSTHGKYKIDTHDAAVSQAVWSLYEEAVKRFGKISTMIERDDHIPPLGELLKELAYAKAQALALDYELS